MQQQEQRRRQQQQQQLQSQPQSRPGEEQPQQQRAWRSSGSIGINEESCMGTVQYSKSGGSRSDGAGL